MVANNTETSPLLQSSDNNTDNNGSNTRVSKRSSQRRGGLYDLKTGYQTANNTTLTTKIAMTLPHRPLLLLLLISRSHLLHIEVAVW